MSSGFKESFQSELSKASNSGDTPEPDFIHKMFDELSPHAAKRAGISITDFKNRFKGLRVVKTIDINGCTFSNDEWKTFEVDIYEGLMIFIHKYFKVIVSMLNTSRSYKGEIETPSLTMDDIVPIANMIMELYWKNNVLQAQGIKLTKLTEGQMILNTELVHNAELFVLAHELGHIILNTNKNAQRYIELSSGNASSDQLSNWNEEVNADILGLKLCLEMKSTRPGVVFNAIELFFLVQGMLVKFYEKTNAGNSLSHETHPPSSYRLRVLRSFVDQSGASEWLVIGKQFEELCDSILDKVLCLHK